MKNILANIEVLHSLDDWSEYKNTAHDLACELLYITTEWDKYYDNNGDKKC
jgi:hypothetical protein